MPDLHKMMDSVCLSVRLSVYGVLTVACLDLTKIDRMEAHHTGNREVNLFRDQVKMLKLSCYF